MTGLDTVAMAVGCRSAALRSYIAASGARALLIGRRALITLGLPLMTRDYDFWLHGDDAARLLEALPDNEREWLATPCGPRETKVFLVAGGTALLALRTNDGKVVIEARGASS